MQYKVPQNIFMEDKIIGPLTLWQFLYLLFGGLIVYISYQFLYANARGLFFVIAAPVSLVSLGAAFVKIHDRPLPTFIKNAISFASRPRQRVWHKEEAFEGTSVITGATVKKIAAPSQAKQLPQADLAKLSEILDTYGRPSSASPAKEVAPSFDKNGLRQTGPPAGQNPGAINK